MIKGLRARSEWIFFSVLPDADRLLAVGWWSVLLLRGQYAELYGIQASAYN